MSNENAPLFRCAFLWPIKSCTKLYYLSLLFRTNAMFSHTKNSIPVTPLTYDVTSASKLRYSHFGRNKKTPKSRLNVFCLPVDPLLFRHNVDSCDATPNATLTQTMSLCKLKYGVVRQNST